MKSSDKMKSNEKKKSNDKRKRIRWWQILLGIVAVIAIVMVVGMIATAPGREELKRMTFADIDFSKLQDGTYIGSYRGEKDSLRDTDVEVTISSGEIVKINATGGALAGEKQNVEVKNGKSLKDIFDHVVMQETLQVDAISGATLTTKSYLKAVENALIKAHSVK